MLPPGIHDATLPEIEIRYGTNDRRRPLLEGFIRGTQALSIAGCKTVYLNGSFISIKPLPGDFDACWDPTGVDGALIDPVLLDFTNKREAQKKKYGGEFFPSSSKANGILTFLEYFQIDKDTGKSKGIIRVHL